MKKYLLAIGLVAFLMTSCCDKQENNDVKGCCKDKKEQCEKKHECGHPGEKQGMCHEMMVQMNIMVKALANWEDLDEAQRADAINMAKEMLAKKEQCQKQNEGCQKQHEGCQKQHEGCKKQNEGCQKQHEGCQKQHEGCQKQNEGCKKQNEGCQKQNEGCQHADK